MSSSRCDVWWATPAVSTPNLLGLLDAVEHERHEAYRRTIDRARFLTGRVVAKAALGAALGIEPARVVLDSTCPDCGRMHGKPRVVAPDGYPADRPLPEMSISHSGDRVAVAITDGLPVGVDVEQERDLQVNEMVRLTLSAAELETFTAIDDANRDAAFFTYWARKEALLKATGKGLAIAMSKVTVTPPDQPPRLLHSDSSEVDVHMVRMAQLDAGSGYRACVAVLGGAEIEPVEHDADPLVATLS